MAKIHFSRLPSEYQEVDWIKGSLSRTEYIPTNYTPSANTEIRTKYYYTDVSSGTGCLDVISNGIGASRGISITYWVAGPSVACSFGSSGFMPGASQQIITSDKEFEVILNKTSATVNGTTYNFSSGSLSTDQLRIFGCIWTVGANYKPPTLKYLQIYESGVLVRDYVPCYRKSDSIAGLYDLINNTFNTNTVPESITKGNDVVSNIQSYKKIVYTISKIPSEYQEVEYLEQTSNTQYINLDSACSFTTPITKLEIQGKIALTQITSGRQFIWSLGSASVAHYLECATDKKFSFGSGTVFDSAVIPVVNQAYSMKHIITPSSSELYIDDVKSLHISAYQSSTDVSNKKLFMLYGTYTGNYLRVYSFTVYENDNKVIELVPCYRKSDSKPGMYNLVNNTFYTNASSGTDFSIGSEINPNKINYKKYINTPDGEIVSYK